MAADRGDPSAGERAELCVDPVRWFRRLPAVMSARGPEPFCTCQSKHGTIIETKKSLLAVALVLGIVAFVSAYWEVWDWIIP
jgi:hypothetical protein